MARGAGRGAAALLVCLAFATPAARAAPVIVGAELAEPTDRYDHGVLGDAIEYGALKLDLLDMPQGPLGATVRRSVTFRLPKARVFEDLAPRLADVTGDGAPEVLVVETGLDDGAQLAVYTAAGKLVATPPLGAPHRWLAPLGAADLDRDGKIEIAYIDRPHVARTLVVWRFDRGRLIRVAAAPGLTAHRIGDRFISGGIRSCRAGAEIVTVSADWASVMATRLEAGMLVTRRLGPYNSRWSLRRALACRM